MDQDRYSRQRRLSQVGMAGQERLAAGHALVLGCGALGSHLSSLLARAGVGRLRLVDRDHLELSNLQRQVLFCEQDVAAFLPKAEAAARRLRQINSGVQVEALVTDATPDNIEQLLQGVDLALDGSDNLETRYLLNDACVKRGLPWVYGGVVGTMGMSLTVVPGQGPCLRCLFPEPPAPGSLPTCETLGVLGTVPAAIAAVQATEAIKLLCGAPPAARLLWMDLWERDMHQVEVSRDAACPACAGRRFDFLDGARTCRTTALCGRDAVQITPPAEAAPDLEGLQAQLASLGEVDFNGLLLRFRPSDSRLEMMLYPDGRVLVRGTTDEAAARSLCARYLGV